MQNIIEKCFILIFILILLLSFIIAFTIVSIKNKGCLIDIKADFTKKHPLLLKQNSNEFILPFNGTKITFYKGEKLRLVCPGKNNRIKVISVQEVLINCVKNQIFTVHNTSDKLFKQLECVKYPEATARRTGRNCLTNFMEMQIGFNTETGFLPLITTCFDEMRKDSIYSAYNLSSNINNQQSASRPNSFKRDFYGNINPTTIYKRKSQINRFEEILHSREIAEKYVSLHNNSVSYLSKGHLTAKADFIYGSQQRATFFYINVAPQWQKFNGKNWNYLENNCRNFASKRRLDLIVYTGVYGNAKLADDAGNFHNLSLHKSINNNNLLTVPEVFWKILYDPISKKGSVFIGHNNPYEKNIQKLCTDVCSQIDWLTWKAGNISLGFSYCCEYEEFKKVNDNLPDIPIHSLLV